MLIRHICANNIGQLSMIKMTRWQLIARVSYQLLERPAEHLPYLSADWFTNYWDFLQEINGSLHIPQLDKHLFPKLRTHDHIIMKQINIHVHLPTHQDIINWICICMHIHSIAEICTADSVQLSIESWQGTQTVVTNCLWPSQTKPDQTSFQIWRRAMSDIFSDAHLQEQ